MNHQPDNLIKCFVIPVQTVRDGNRIHQRARQDASFVLLSLKYSREKCMHDTYK